MPTTIMGYLQWGVLIGSLSIIAFLWISNKGLSADLENSKLLVEGYKKTEAADKLQITNLKEILMSQEGTELRFTRLETAIKTGLKETRNDIVRKIPPAAREPTCAIPISVLRDAIRTTRSAAGLPVTDVVSQ